MSSPATRSTLLSPAALLLLLFVAADAAFVALHVINERTLGNPLYALDVDSSYADIFQFVKMFWLVLLLALVSVATRTPLYAGWAAIFAWFAADDVLGIREQAGAWMAARFDAFIGPLGLERQGLAELLVLGGVIAGLLAAITLFYRSSGADARSVSKDLLLLFCAFAFFGVFLDLVQRMAEPSWAGALLIVLEDGGEMMAISLLAAYAFALRLRGAEPGSARAGG